MKIFKATVIFHATVNKAEYGRETYYLPAASEASAKTAALKLSEDSHYDDVRVEHYRRVEVEAALVIGETFIMPDPNPALNDAWAHGNWEGEVVGFRCGGKLITVRDQDEMFYDIETERVVELIKEEANA